MLKFKPQKAFLIVLTFTSLLLITISVASDSWVRKQVNNQEGSTYYEKGLWQTCDPQCTPFTAEHAINTSRTFGIMACLEILVAWALAIVAYIEYRVKGYMVTMFATAAGVSMFISLIVYTVTNNSTLQDYTYSWSFIVGWTSVIFALLSATWGLYSVTQNEEEILEMKDPS